MGRPKHDPNTRPTRERILDAAASTFAAEGFANANLSDIAAAVNIRRPSLLYHFDTKERLYATVVEETLGALAAALAMPMQVEGTFEARLEAVTRQFLCFLDEHPPAAGLIVRELLTPCGPGVELFVVRAGQLLDQVEAWVQSAGGERVREVNVRGALLQVVSSALLCRASDRVTAALWGEQTEDEAWALTRAMVLKDAAKEETT